MHGMSYSWGGLIKCGQSARSPIDSFLAHSRALIALSCLHYNYAMTIKNKMDHV